MPLNWTDFLQQTGAQGYANARGSDAARSTLVTSGNELAGAQAEANARTQAALLNNFSDISQVLGPHSLLLSQIAQQALAGTPGDTAASLEATLPALQAANIAQRFGAGVGGLARGGLSVQPNPEMVGAMGADSVNRDPALLSRGGGGGGSGDEPFYTRNEQGHFITDRRHIDNVINIARNTYGLTVQEIGGTNDGLVVLGPVTNPTNSGPAGGDLTRY